MGSLDSALTRKALAQNTVIRHADDEPVAIRIRQVGGAAVTSVTVTTATNIVLIDADGTTTSTFATDDTIGKVADTINASANWECKVLDALRSDASASKLVDGAISASVTDGVTYYDVKTDTSALDAYTIRCTYDRGVNLNRPKGAHRVKLLEAMYNLDINAASANGFRIYEWDDTAKSETQIYGIASVDATETTVNFGSGEATIDSGFGNDLIVRVIDATSITDSGNNFMQCIYTKE